MPRQLLYKDCGCGHVDYRGARAVCACGWWGPLAYSSSPQSGWLAEGVSCVCNGCSGSRTRSRRHSPQRTPGSSRRQFAQSSFLPLALGPASLQTGPCPSVLYAPCAQHAASAMQEMLTCQRVHVEGGCFGAGAACGTYSSSTRIRRRGTGPSRRTPAPRRAKLARGTASSYKK